MPGSVPLSTAGGRLVSPTGSASEGTSWVPQPVLRSNPGANGEEGPDGGAMAGTPTKPANGQHPSGRKSFPAPRSSLVGLSRTSSPAPSPPVSPPGLLARPCPSLF
eukprot:CAMPEP_0177615452 /NCGR_PEP_ID=MMETSP0419_2-20121207/23450_1 /TAXON_ID=582737 /ORGANISM="Tetraselmis sp., Strain GSL018" /LENGTH=105 /DNA_ID=CAMNT_0019113085 /DNA_START=379 /DNA_END=693 /DNA_ORIENTATION=-